MHGQERICVTGDPNQIDSFVACLTGVLNLWGVEVSYDWVAGLAGTAFAPILDTEEDCAAWWMESGSDRRLGFVGRALGFIVDRVVRDVPWDDTARAKYARTGLLPAPHETHFARLRAAFDRGDAILLRTWPAWSVLTGWAQDLDRLPFATVPGLEAIVSQVWRPAQAQLAYLLDPAPPALTPEESTVAALRYGARVASGMETGTSTQCGAALYLAAAARLSETAFCPSCGDQSDSCAHRTLNRMLGTQRSARNFLLEAKSFLGTRGPWERPIDILSDMIAITSAYCEWESFHAAWSEENFRGQIQHDLHRLARLQEQTAQALRELVDTLEETQSA